MMNQNPPHRVPTVVAHERCLRPVEGPGASPGQATSLDELPDFLASKIRPNAITGCWEWIGARDSRGYGNVRVNGRVRKAHCVLYEVVRGRIPPELESDHLCRVPWCVNPSHLELVSHAENVRRGAARW